MSLSMHLGHASRAGAGQSGAAAGVHATALQLPKLAGREQYATWREEALVWLDRHDAQGVHLRGITLERWTALVAYVESQRAADAEEALYAVLGAPKQAAASPSASSSVKPEEEPSPEQKADLEADRERHRKTALALHDRSMRVYGALHAALSAGMRQQAEAAVSRGCAHLLWLWIERKFQPTDLDNISTLFEQWTSMRQEEEESFDTYRARVNALLALLERAKQPQTPALYSHILTDRLRPRYAQVVLALKVGGKLTGADIDWEAVTESINSHERNEAAQSSRPGESVSMVRANRFAEGAEGSRLTAAQALAHPTAGACAAASAADPVSAGTAESRGTAATSARSPSSGTDARTNPHPEEDTRVDTNAGAHSMRSMRAEAGADAASRPRLLTVALSTSTTRSSMKETMKVIRPKGPSEHTLRSWTTS